jgi:predicted Rossmann-fold nucleotide-binding protein
MPQTIVGVFGPSGLHRHGPTARALGRSIAATDILLTGGSGVVDSSVKEQAIAGARVALERGGVGRWLGIPKSGRAVAPPADAGGHLLSQPYGDERNLLNAMVAQAAIALRGGPGTDSEVAFALALRRPVVLLGPGWAGFRADGPRLAAMIDALFDPGSTDGPGAMSAAIAAARRACATLTDPDVTVLPRPADVDVAVGAALARAVPADLDALDALIGTAAAEDLRSWIER